MMNTPEQDDTRLDPILNEIRSLGTPYSEEPDPGYFANFRVRVMDEIDRREAGRRGFFVRLSEWFAAKPLRSGVIGLSSVAIILLGVYLGKRSNSPQDVAAIQPQQNEQIAPQGGASRDAVKQPELSAQSSQSVAVQQSPSTHVVASQIAPGIDTVAEPVVSKELAATIDSSIAHASPEELAENLEASSGAPAITSNEKDVPVSLSDLSEAELVGVLHSLEQSN